MAALADYDRAAAVSYAHLWAFGRNPKYYNYDLLGGDCTNFASQCIFAGSGVMDYTPDTGWYYMDANRKAPAWTGVEQLGDFLLRGRISPGPRARRCGLSELLPGDLVQLSLTGGEFAHTPVVVAANPPFAPENILLAAHSYDADYRPLATYGFRKLRPLHIVGITRG